MRRLRHERSGKRAVEMSLASCLPVRKLEPSHQERSESFFCPVSLPGGPHASCICFIAPFGQKWHFLNLGSVGRFKYWQNCHI